MAFFTSAITTLQTLVVALGAGVGVWGLVNLLEGYGNDNPGAKISGNQTAHGGRGHCGDRHHTGSSPVRTVRLIYGSGLSEKQGSPDFFPKEVNRHWTFCGIRLQNG